MTGVKEPNLAAGVIGNCVFNALIDARGRIVWCCLPRPDGDPVFNALLAGAKEARELFEALIDSCNPLGLLSEHIDPESKELWGNLPQTYSMVGIINGATRLSRRWETVL